MLVFWILIDILCTLWPHWSTQPCSNCSIFILIIIHPFWNWHSSHMFEGDVNTFKVAALLYLQLGNYSYVQWRNSLIMNHLKLQGNQCDSGPCSEEPVWSCIINTIYTIRSSFWKPVIDFLDIFGLKRCGYGLWILVVVCANCCLATVESGIIQQT